MIRILVTGSEGQLGRSLQKIVPDYPDFQFVFTNSNTLNIADKTVVDKIFTENTFHYCVNCAAYTNVEGAEKDPKKAFAINFEGVRNLAIACREYEVTLIHLSTDYVFDGEKKGAYTVRDTPNPINVYGQSKLAGERYVQKELSAYFIIRTSWLYSQFGKNFYKTILQKARTESVIRVTDKQIGCPTHAGTLATFVMNLISSKSEDYGLHHITDGEAMTWYDFAKKIVKENGMEADVQIEKLEQDSSIVRRPKNSVLG